MRRSWLAAAAGVVAVLAVLLPASPEANAGNSQEDLIVEFVSRVSDGDATAADLIAEDFVLTSVGDGSFAIYGKTAFAGVVESFGEGGTFDVTVDDLSTSGNVVTGTLHTSDDDTEAAGVDSYQETLSATVISGLITKFDLAYDLDDPDTVTYIEYLDTQPDEDEGEDPDGVVTLAAQPGGNQPGEAALFGIAPGVVGVGIEITPGPAGVLQPAHIHSGTCAAPGPIVEPLAFPQDGASFSIISANITDLVGKGLILNVHKSVAEASVYVSCGEVLAAGAAPAPTAPAPGSTPPAASPTPRTGVTAPSTGTGPTGGAGYAWVLMALLGAGTLLAATGALGRRRS